MRAFILFLLLAFTANAQDITSLTTYVGAQIPNNNTRQIAPVNVRNAVLAFPNNVFVSSSYPVTTTSYVSAVTYYGDGSNLTGISGGASPTWYSIQNIPTVIQNISNSTGSVSVSTVSATLVSGPQNNVTRMTGLTEVSVTGNVSVTTINGVVPTFGGSPSWYDISNIPTQVQGVSDSGSIFMEEVSATRLYGASISGSLTGIVLTSSQPNITSVGTLTGLTVSGAVTATGSLLNVSNVSATGNLSVTTINGSIPVFGGAPSWYTITAIPGPVQAVSNGTTLNMASIGVTGTVTATTVSSTALNSTYVSTTQIFTGTISTTGFVSNSATYSNYMREGKLIVAATTATTVLNFGLATEFYVNMTSSTTISTTNVNFTHANVAVVIACQDGSGGRVITWPTNARFSLSISPTQVTTANTCSRYNMTPVSGTLIWVEGGARGVSAT